MRAEKVKCWVGNLDGKRQGLIVAHNQKEAANLAGTSIGSFRDHWSLQVGKWPLTTPKILTLYTRPYGSLAADSFQEEQYATKTAPDSRSKMAG